MKHLLTLCAVLATVVMTGCASTSYTKFTYEYQAPAEFTLSEKHKTIAFKSTGVDFDRTLSQLNHPVKGLTWINDTEKSDLVIDFRLQESSTFKSEMETDTAEKKDSNGKKVKYKTYRLPGGIQTAYDIELYDRINNSYIKKYHKNYVYEISGSEKTSKLATTLALLKKGKDDKSMARMIAGKEGLRKTKRLLDMKLTTHDMQQPLRVPESDENEARIAQAYIILTTNSGTESAKKALAIYKAIGTNNLDKDGKDNEDLNEAVFAAMSACYYILGDLHQYEINKESSKVMISYKTEAEF